MRIQLLRYFCSRLFPSHEFIFFSQDFYRDLQGHILSRLTGRDYDGEEFDFTLQECSSLRIEQNRIYKHKVLRKHYTTYDMKRSTDSINPRVPDHANVLIYGPEGEPWYARVIGVFHVNIRLASEEEFHRMDILRVRWYGEDTTWPHGPSVKHLPRLGFIPYGDNAVFGFLDPSDVVRSVHLIPGFNYGKTEDYLPPSSASQSPSENNEDWVYYYVNV